MPLQVTTPGDTEVDPAAEGAAALPHPDESAIDRLRARYKRLDDGTEEFDIPPYGGLLVARYRRLQASEDAARQTGRRSVTELRRLAGDEEDFARAFNELLLVEACDELLIRHDDGTLEPLGTPAIRFDERLAEALDLAVQAPESLLAREVLRRAFNANELAVNAHAADVYAWMIYGSLQEESPGEA